MIPQPRELNIGDSSFLLPAELSLLNAPCPILAERIQGDWHKLLQLNIIQSAEGVLEIRWHNFAKLAASHKDMYMILVQPNIITLSAKSETGFRYAWQTLKQLLFIAVHSNKGYLPCQTIVDYPQWNWRGMHLDESRHFFGMETVKQMLRCMEALKLNKFHWHLTDDQGWRIESKLFPRLTEIGACRKEPDGNSYGAFYTQAEIREIVQYANNLGIEVIPEIDLPGHAAALLAAYPELACFPREFEPLTVWGISEDILCAGKDSVLEFLGALLGEMAELFSGDYFHLGGDEAPKHNWQRCPACQARLKTEGLANEEELQSWLIKQLAKMLEQKGKTVIGWDEILDGKITSEPVVMVWRGDGIDAAKMASANGNSFILCPNKICYFDWRQYPDSSGAHGVSTIENVYSLDPSAYGDNNLCLGGQANLWSEHIHNRNELFNMMLPRAFALAEVLWNPNKDYAGFLSRLSELEAYFETLC